ncbi:MAG: CPBP family intramembrane glutamic endopeptidase [Ignavibacteria bacterium]
MDEIKNNASMNNSGFSVRHWVMILAPVILIIFMWTLFVNLTQYFGLQEGYLFAFIIYWLLWCILLPAYALKGFKNVFSLFKKAVPRFGDKPDITLFLISWPVVVSLIFAFLPRLNNITIPVVLYSVLLGLVNGFCEEILWRGVYLTLFPRKTWLGYIYPAVLFALWHICPISVTVTRFAGGIYSFLIISFLFGLSWGFYTRKTGSILWSSIMHAVCDTLGLGAILYIGWFL